MKAYGIICAIAMTLSVVSAAQNLKPAKDKSTKKYGYQTKGSKAWVIAPNFDDAKKFVDGTAEVEIGGLWGLIDINGNMIFPAAYDKIGKFDKNGYCELMRKQNGVKLHGVADRYGRIIIPVEARSVDVDRSGEFIYAKYDTAVPGFEPDAMWGVYDNMGRELLSPQLSYSPSFRDGYGIGKSAITGLYGVMGADGSVIRPFNYLNITRFSGGFKALGPDLTHYVWSPDLRDSQALRQPGAIIPYDPKGDPVRAAAWNRGPVGRRLYSNTVRTVEFHTGLLGSVKAACTMPRINWGFGRFIRLEPCVVPAGTPDAMRYGSGNRYYTLKAILYEPDGRFVQEVCSRGWIEANCSEGAIYNANGKERWMILADPNSLALPAYTMDVVDYRPTGHADVFEGLGFSISELNSLCRLYNFTSLCKDIYETENVGVCSYIPRMPSEAHARAEFTASKAPVFHYPFRMGQVVNCVVKEKDGKPFVELMPDLVCLYKDRLDDPSYTMSEREEVIYWGPNNARTVKLSLEAVSRSDRFMADDVHGTPYSYRLVLDMFEEDGTWLRTLAAAPWADFVQDGIIVFEPLGIALISPFAGHMPPKGKPMTNTQPKAQPNAQAQNPVNGHVVENRNGEPGRNHTEVRGGARESVGGAGNTDKGKPADVEHGRPGDLQPLPHTLSALEASLR